MYRLHKHFPLSTPSPVARPAWMRVRNPHWDALPAKPRSVDALTAWTERHPVLYVDDSDDLLIVTRLILGVNGICAAVTSNPHDALDLCRLIPVSLLITNVTMGRIDGFTLHRLVASNRATEHIPVMYLTARSLEHDVRHGYELGAVDYLFKPATPGQLVTRVRHALLKYGNWRIPRDFDPVRLTAENVKRDVNYWHSLQDEPD